ncbi:MAG: helix-turn-helix domain-containing protein, partial [Draconibacterium sp.]
TNVRVIAATNVNIPKAIEEGKFREDLYYRLNTVPITILPLRERPDDVNLLFRKFARDFAEKYRMPPVRLTEDARSALMNFRWPGNIRQLKNVTEQISIIEQEREITAEVLQEYLPFTGSKNLPAIFSRAEDNRSFANEREILYKVLFDMKKDMTDLKKLVLDLMQNRDGTLSGDQAQIIRNLYDSEDVGFSAKEPASSPIHISHVEKEHIQDTEEFVEESLSLADKEIELIQKALEKHRGKRKYAAQELGISERTLYRKIKEYDIKG